MTHSEVQSEPPLIQATAEGLYCRDGDFHIDPHRPVQRAILTHAHADHARAGSAAYWSAQSGMAILRKRLGGEAPLHGVPYGRTLRFGNTRVSLHPAGHILGSSQVRVERDGEVWVVSGDYKRAPDPTCSPFEVVPCHTLVTEATFALPIYRWPPAEEVARSVLQWWRANAECGRTSVLFCYALGKAQRLLAELGRLTRQPVFLHGAIAPLVALYREAGVELPPTQRVSEAPRGHRFAGELVLAPPSAAGSPWMKRFRPASLAFASGWMRVRGQRRRRAFDRGFVLSDHADWPALLRTIEECGAQRVLVTHGRGDTLVRYLRERGVDAAPLADGGW